MTVEIRYGVTFGKCDSSDWIDWEVDLTEEEEAAYKKAARMGVDPNEVEELQAALQRAYDDIEAEEISMGIDNGDEYVLECQGMAEMDPEELNDLVHDRDPHALEFFGLTDASDEEIEEWDANDLDEIPQICDFEEDFEPYSPYAAGWTLNVEFPEPDDEDVIKYWLEYLSAEEKYRGCVFEAPGVYFVIGNGSLWEISDDAGYDPKGGWFPEIFSGPTKEEADCLKQMMEGLGFEEDFFAEMIDDCGDFDGEDAEAYFEENNEDALKIYRKIKEKVESGKTPFSCMEDFVNALTRIDLEEGCLYYEWEGEIIDLHDNISDVGEGRGEFDSLDDYEWIEIFQNIDEHIVRG